MLAVVDRNDRVGALPVGDGTGFDGEERMRQGRRGQRHVGAAHDELAPQVRELERQLSVAHGYPGCRCIAGGARAVDARAVEAVAARIRLGRHLREVGADARERFRLALESLQLRVPRVAARAPGQHRLSEQPLPPARGEPLPVEDGWMQ